MNVQCVALLNGQILTGAVEETDTEVTITKPVTFGMTQQGVAMMPPTPFMEHNDITVSKDHIIYMLPAIPEAAQAWNEEYGNGLTLPPENPQLIV